MPDNNLARMAAAMLILAVSALADPTPAATSTSTTTYPAAGPDEVVTNYEDSDSESMVDTVVGISLAVLLLLYFCRSCRALCIEQPFDSFGRNFGVVEHAPTLDQRKKRMEKILEAGLIPVAPFRPDASSERDACCAICLVELEEDEQIRELGCGHFFHVDCVDPWLLNKQTCPLCKEDVLARAEAAATSGHQTPAAGTSPARPARMPGRGTPVSSPHTVVNISMQGSPASPGESTRFIMPTFGEGRGAGGSPLRGSPRKNGGWTALSPTRPGTEGDGAMHAAEIVTLLTQVENPIHDFQVLEIPDHTGEAADRPESHGLGETEI